MTLTPNPFTNRGPVTNPEDFFGRRDQLATIRSDCNRCNVSQSLAS